MGVNKVILVGRLGKDPELRYTAGQTAVAKFSLATGERRKDANGNWADHTEWHNVVVFGKTAENCMNFLKKGREVFIEGRIQTQKWQDKEGRDRYTTEVIAQNVQFLGGAQGGSRTSQVETINAPSESGAAPVGEEVIPTPATGEPGEVSFNDDDIPF